MTKYRKTALIEAYLLGDPDAPQEFVEAVCLGSKPGCWNLKDKPHIHTLEGIHYASATDWIARGVKGEFWPIKDEIFRLTYEKADETVSDSELIDRWAAARLTYDKYLAIAFEMAVPDGKGGMKPLSEDRAKLKARIQMHEDGHDDPEVLKLRVWARIGARVAVE